MNAEDRYAANYALRAATNLDGKSYMDLTVRMCWDAVMHCAVAANIITESRASLLESKLEMVNTSDFAVKNHAQLMQVEAGCALGFFDGNKIVHCMISLGGGMAAGNKNDCMGFGMSVGWEKHDLSILRWNDNGTFSAPRGVTTTGNNNIFRAISIYYRPLSYLKYK